MTLRVTGAGLETLVDARNNEGVRVTGAGLEALVDARNNEGVRVTGVGLEALVAIYDPDYVPPVESNGLAMLCQIIS